MVRWEPGARERLQAAALELYVHQGYEQTTAAEIARAVGLTERTFFRHFADKREVLFHGQEEFRQVFVSGVVSAPAGGTPLELVAAALAAAATFFPDERRSYSRLRQQVIDAHPALQERELLKLAAVADAVGAALRDRGVAEPAATLAAESGLTVFRVAFVEWLADEGRSMLTVVREVLGELGTTTAGAAGALPPG
ncbi:TetR/AcrR family transcriptional regulator [uncultured Friedmanniella sp.]|uniref:TetR/AcrR family transcriptional regulator n=1 Tax=uncultured Friedmanniella sp. TaxID=335381 RepID=UPI0035C955E0